MKVPHRRKAVYDFCPVLKTIIYLAMAFSFLKTGSFTCVCLRRLTLVSGVLYCYPEDIRDVVIAFQGSAKTNKHCFFFLVERS